MKLLQVKSTNSFSGNLIITVLLLLFFKSPLGEEFKSVFLRYSDCTDVNYAALLVSGAL